MQIKLELMTSAHVHYIFTILKRTLEYLPGSSDSLFLEFFSPFTWSHQASVLPHAPRPNQPKPADHASLPHFRGDFASLLCPTFLSTNERQRTSLCFANPAKASYRKSWRGHELTRETERWTAEQNLLSLQLLKEFRKSAKALVTGHESFLVVVVVKSFPQKNWQKHRHRYTFLEVEIQLISFLWFLRILKDQGHLHVDKNSWGQVDQKRRRPFLQRNAPCDSPRRRRNI